MSASDASAVGSELRRAHRGEVLISLTHWLFATATVAGVWVASDLPFPSSDNLGCIVRAYGLQVSAKADDEKALLHCYTRTNY